MSKESKLDELENQLNVDSEKVSEADQMLAERIIEIVKNSENPKEIAKKIFWDRLDSDVSEDKIEAMIENWRGEESEK